MTRPAAPPDTQIAFIGGGHMARSLIGGLVRTGVAPADLRVGEPNVELAAALGRDFGVAAGPDNDAAVDAAGTWVLAVKPQATHAVCTTLRAAAQDRAPLVISIAAGIRTDQIETWLGGGIAVVRAMPNTPALIGAGATGLFATAQVDAQRRAIAERVLGAVGLTEWIAEEALMDTVTAVSGSGPAYFFLLVEALEEAGVAGGLPRDTARRLAIRTCLGAGRMLAEEEATEPAQLRRRVTSPGGTTQAALDSFAANRFDAIVAQAVRAATQRGRELSAHFGDE